MNRLSSETSPYLLQHADNPVHWHPWDDAALEAAKTEQKPILLSIGYSACHWCHVMAHESFEDTATAAVMNQHFINIKVDREERPDLDKVYQLAHQLLTQSGGGWPLTMFLDPDTLLPFFGGTYFPNSPKYGLPSFTDLLLRISGVFAEQREELKEQGGKIGSVLEKLQFAPSAAELADEALLEAARQALGKQYDAQHAGFGTSPKFPMPTTVERLLRHWAFSTRAGERDRDGLDMVMLTLTAMARGGIYDHIGGGFCRYATDRQWQVPHFEKMLYDNGQLLTVYSEAFARTGRSDFRRVIERTAAYMRRELKAPGGAFFAAMDAESEKVEGKFYRWTPDEIKSILGAEYDFYAKIYGLNGPPNFEEHYYVPLLESTLPDAAKANGMTESQLYEKLDAANEKLLATREKRPRPLTDNKILASWNGLAIRGLADAGRTLKQPELVKSAADAADFILQELRTPEGRMHRTYTDGKASLNGYLDDYSFVANGLIALHRATDDDKWLKAAAELTEKQIELFWDQDSGAFFFTSADHEALIARTKTFSDNVQPAGNTVAAENLTYLATVLKKPDYHSKAKSIVEAGASFMKRVPRYAPRLLLSGREFLAP